MLACLTGTHDLMAQMLYGSGLRISAWVRSLFGRADS